MSKDNVKTKALIWFNEINCNIYIKLSHLYSSLKDHILREFFITRKELNTIFNNSFLPTDLLDNESWMIYATKIISKQNN